ncbi:hypothetical protein J4457_06525, partial [Candidatus Woesearchaeota archaeon]|nr:hypothetical protein [Candidatus Woesearchaeota archaeon]
IFSQKSVEEEKFGFNCQTLFFIQNNKEASNLGYRGNLLRNDGSSYTLTPGGIAAPASVGAGMSANALVYQTPRQNGETKK